MYFTRDPVIETVITSREGYKLSVRNTKHFSQDPFVVEAVEVISLGNTCFFRNCDHSKPFIVPAGDYEVMEIRDTKINLKAVGLDRGIKIAGGREALIKLPKAAPVTVEESSSSETVATAESSSSESSTTPSSHSTTRKEKKERKGDKWKEKKKQGRKKANKEVSEVAGSSQEIIDTVTEELWEESQENKLGEQKKFSLLPPPAKLISEIISQTISDPEITSADLDESLQALVTESSEVINALLSGDQTIIFPEEEMEASPVCEQPVCEQPLPSSFPMEDE